MMRFGILFLLLHFLRPLSAQVANDLPGVVLSRQSGEKLAGASISIYQGNRISGLIANKEGRFVISAGTVIDSLHVSMIGHWTKSFPGVELGRISFLQVQLDIAAAALPEVVVKPFTALDVIKKAIARLTVNQPSDDFENKGFYREIIKDREKYYSVAEAVFTAQYFPAKKDYLLKLEQGRSKEDVAATRLFEDFHPGGGPQAVAGNSFISSRPAFLDLKAIGKFNYRIDSMLQFDGRWLYQISFDQKPGVKEALDKGVVLIETEDYAVVRYQVANSPIGSPYIKSLTGSDKLVAGLLNIDFKRKGWKREADFSKINNRWVMSHTATEYAIAYQQPKKQLDLDLVIDIELLFTSLDQSIQNVIARGEEWKKKDIVANLPSAFDSAFWAGKNILSPTEEINQIIAGIAARNNERPVAAIPGWQYLNRNLFIAYPGTDTITLLPLMKSNWEDESTGGMLYRETDSNFILETRIRLVRHSDESRVPDRGFQQAGIMVRSADSPKENYIFLSVGTGGNPNPKLFFKRTLDNNSKTVVEKINSMNGWLRLEKSGGKILAFFKGETDPDYHKAGEYNLAWLNGKLQIGYALFAAFAGDGPKMKPDMRAMFTPLKIELK